MMQDIERICTEPTAEDQQWFPEIAGSGDPMAVLRDVWANYRDESFILQYLSPRLIREFGLFHVLDDASEPNLRVRRSTTNAAIARSSARWRGSTTSPGHCRTSRWWT